MPKIILDDTSSGYNLSKINSNFKKIEEELNNKVLYRSNPVGEANQLESDVDANGKKIYNVQELSVTDKISVRGQDMTDTFETLIANAEAEADRAEAAAQLAISSGSDVFQAEGEGSVQRSVLNKLREYVSAEDFGAKGDGVTDDTLSFTAMMSAGAGKILTLNSVKTYRVTSSVIVPENTILNLNGSTIRFEVTGSSNCLDLRSNTVVRNGHVELAGSSYTGHGGNGCPVVIGDYGVGTGYKNIVVEDLTITSNKPDGNGILVTGDSSNITIQNIRFTSGSSIGRAICVHWGNANTPANGTKHPYNISIHDIDIGDQTYDSGANGAVFLSGIYNCLVRNVRGGVCTNYALVRVFCGDYGFTYAPTNVAANGMCGVTIQDCTIEKAKHLFQGTMKDTHGSLTLWPSSVTLVRLTGGSDITGDTLRRAFQVELLNDLRIEECTAIGFYDGCFLGSTVHRLKLLRNKFLNTYRSAVYFISTGTPNYKDIEVEGNYFKDSNTGNVAGQADLNIAMVEGVEIHGNVFDSPLCDWNVRAQGGASSPSKVACEDNISRNVKSSAGPAFSFGGSGDYGILKTFINNVVLVVPTNGIVSGQVHKPFLNAPGGHGAGSTHKWMMYSGAPTAGTWNVGDKVYNSAPAAGGVEGWICVAAGTPGTWKSFGSIAA